MDSQGNIYGDLFYDVQHNFGVYGWNILEILIKKNYIADGSPIMAPIHQNIPWNVIITHNNLHFLRSAKTWKRKVCSMIHLYEKLFILFNLDIHIKRQKCIIRYGSYTVYFQVRFLSLSLSLSLSHFFGVIRCSFSKKLSIPQALCCSSNASCLSNFVKVNFPPTI